MLYEMPLHPEPFDLIARGMKTVELRMNYNDWVGIKPGDEIVFMKRPDFEPRIRAEVLEVLAYESFDAAIDAHDLTDMGYVDARLERLQSGDHGLYAYYTPEQEREFGVLAIRFCCM